MNDTAARVRQVLANELYRSLDEVTDASDLVDDLRADDLDRVVIVMALEDEFDLEISDAEAEAVKTVGDAIKLVEGKLSAKVGA